jgi:hypothetical protein
VKAIVTHVVMISEVSEEDRPRLNKVIQKLLEEESVRVVMRREDRVILVPGRNMAPVEVKVSLDLLLKRRS